MWRAYVAEWTKIRRRTVLAAPAAMIGFMAIGMYFGLTRLSSRPGAEVTALRLSRPDGLVLLLQRGADLISVITLITIAAVVGAEWSQGTLRSLLAQEPRRLRLMAGKIAALFTFLLASAAVAVAIACAIAAAVAPGSGVPTTAWWSADGIQHARDFVVNLAIALTGWTVVGAFAAVIVRSAAAAVGASIAWLIVVEGLMTQVWPDVGRWLPGRLLLAVLSGGTTDIAYPSALSAAAGYCVAMVLIAGVSLSLRDVTA